MSLLNFVANQDPDLISHNVQPSSKSALDEVV